VGKHYGEQRIVVGAPPAACFDALTAYESFPEWQRAVKAVDVLTRDAAGRGENVAFEVDVKLRTVRYELRYSYEPPHRIWWDYVAGDVKDVDGEFLLESCGDEATRATYRVGLDPGVWVPGPVFRVLNDQAMRWSVEDLKRRVEGS
jgi:hypothetical protein